MLKFTNKEHTAAVFGNEHFSLSSPECWDSIGPIPTRDAVKKYLENGGVAEEMDEPSPNIAILSKIDEIERATLMNRGAREGWIALIEKEAASQGITDEAVISQYNPFYRKLIEVNNQIKALRDQLV